MNGNNGDFNNKHKNKIDSDYLDLLNKTNVTDEEIRNSVQRRTGNENGDGYEDVYSHSESYVDEDGFCPPVFHRTLKPFDLYEDVYSSDERYLPDERRSQQPSKGQTAQGSRKMNVQQNYEYDDDPDYAPRKNQQRGQTPPAGGRQNQGRGASQPEQYEDDSDYAPWKNQQRGQTPPPVKKQQSSDEFSDYEERRAKKKKHGHGGRILIFLLVLIIALGGAGWFSVSGIVGNFEHAKIGAHYEGELVGSSAVTNVLLIGLDKEKGGASRSDSIMICSVNKSTGKVVLTSILRDTHLDIPGECEAKVNAAYARGGADLLVQTIEKNFGIKINEYACVNFEMFTELVDGLGGIDIEVTEDESNYINYRHNYKGAKKPDFVDSGESVHLNGYQALWYSRIRYLDSDFMRTFRQRKVLTAIAGDIKGQLTPAGIAGLLKTAKNVAPYIETTLSTPDLIKLALSLGTCLAKSGADIDEMLISQKIPFDGTWDYANKWDGSSIVIDLEENRQLLYSSIYEAPEEPTESE